MRPILSKAFHELDFNGAIVGWLISLYTIIALKRKEPKWRHGSKLLNTFSKMSVHMNIWCNCIFPIYNPETDGKIGATICQQLEYYSLSDISLIVVLRPMQNVSNTHSDSLKECKPKNSKLPIIINYHHLFSCKRGAVLYGCWYWTESYISGNGIRVAIWFVYKQYYPLYPDFIEDVFWCA